MPHLYARGSLGQYVKYLIVIITILGHIRLMANVDIKYVKSSSKPFTCVNCGEHVPEESQCVYVSKNSDSVILLRKMHLDCFEDMDVSDLMGLTDTLAH